MDTLFRLVSSTLHHQSSDQSFNSSTTQTSSSTSLSSLHHHNHHHHNPPPPASNYVYEEECFTLFMDNNSSNDQEDFSSSSSKHHQPYYAPNNPTVASSITYSHYPSTTTTPNTTEFSFSPPPPPPRDLSPNPDFFSSFSGERWASDILLETGQAVADKNSSRVHHFMWMLNELSSPYGDTDQKLASYFLQALFSRITDTGDRSYRALISATEKSTSFESTRKMLLKFQEVSPWTTFGHVACNGAIMEALEGETKLHIVDISDTYCTQWPTLLEALATRTDDTPHLRLTILMPGSSSSGPGPVQKLMREIGNRMEKFARLMGVPFKFNVIHHEGDLSDINNLSELLDIKDDEALAINCVNALHTIRPPCRDIVTSLFRILNPRIITVVEEEADLDVGPDGFDFLKGYQECLRWFRVYFEALDESFSRTSNERLMLERAAGRAIMDLLAGPVNESVERRETAGRWSMRLHGGGFSPVCFSDEVSDDVRALLRRYKEGWSMNNSSQGGGGHMNAAGAGIFLTWKDQPVVWASAWKPAS